jgi:hypothetical protein
MALAASVAGALIYIAFAGIPLRPVTGSHLKFGRR